MKRILSLTLLMTFVLSILSACGGGDPQVLLSFNPANDDYGTPDFNGAKFYTTGGWALFETVEESKLDTIDSDRKLYRTAQIEKLLNVDLVQDNDAQSEDSSYYYTLFLANNLKYHISPQYGTPNPVYDMYKSGMLEALENIPAIDLTDEEFYGSANGRRAVTFEGKTYAHMGGVDEEGTDRGYLVYNDYYIDMFGVEDPQELYEQGKWTFETFADMLTKVSDLSNPDKPIYAMSLYCDPQMLPFCAVFANGGKIVKENSNGKYVFALEDPEAMEALQWVANLRTNCNITFDDWPCDDFKNGLSTFYLGRSFSTQNALAEDSAVEEFYYIPFPYGPNGEYGVSKASYASEEGGIVFFVDKDMDFVGKVFDAWLRFDDYPDDLVVDKAEYALSNNFWSEESYAHYLSANDTTEYDYFSQIGADLYREFTSALQDATTGLNNFSSVFDSYRTLIQDALDASLNN